MNILQRPRRNRKSEVMRSLMRETLLTQSDLIAPLFVIEGKGVKNEISSMPGQFRLSIDNLLVEAKELWDLGIGCVSLFPVVENSLKDKRATYSLKKDGLLPRAIRAVKEQLPEMLVMSDVAMDPYSSDGHDGLVKGNEILNDETLDILGQMALVQAQAGADIVGPSDMMDGRVKYIRQCLDQDGFSNVSIMAYTAKYASAFYGPFRDALDSAPKHGDKKSYQMDYHNRREALREARLDQLEGADILMVKPGLPYLDVIAMLKEQMELPIAAYNVSGEYAMIKAAAQRGWIDGEKAMVESLVAIKRAGADIILSYFAKEMARALIV